MNSWLIRLLWILLKILLVFLPFYFHFILNTCLNFLVVKSQNTWDIVPLAFLQLRIEAENEKGDEKGERKGVEMDESRRQKKKKKKKESWLSPLFVSFSPHGASNFFFSFESTLNNYHSKLKHILGNLLIVTGDSRQQRWANPESKV